MATILASIPSYGIILFTSSSTTDDIPKFLLQQRRDTYEYMDIIRGTYTTESRFFELFACISIEEKNRIRDYTFQELWIDLWLSPHSIHRKDYQIARKKYEEIKPKLQEVLIDSGDIQFCSSPPWGFPKGKKHKRESDIKCALREFEEETLLQISNIAKIWDVDPIMEHYKGNNGRYYNTSYFIVESEGMLDIKYTPTTGIIRTRKISDEAGDLRWVTLKEAKRLLNPRRFQILKNVKKLIDNRYKNIVDDNSIEHTINYKK